MMVGGLPWVQTALLGAEHVQLVGEHVTVIIDYAYANYSVEQVKADYVRVSDELRKVQTALDLVNTTMQFEFIFPD